MAGSYILNGNGELAGLAWLQESGYIEVPLLITNTLNVGKVADAEVSWLLKRHPRMGVTDDVPIPMVAECDDSTLNDIQGRHVKESDVFKALDSAAGGPVPEGSAGAGTGMMCYEFKGGVGTSSRVLPPKEGGYTVGVFTLTNFGERQDLMIDGVPVGKEIRDGILKRHTDGSIVTVVATDAPLSPGQLNRLAKRASLGMARTGAVGHHGSGDVFVAFSTGNRIPRNPDGFTYSAKFLSDDRLDPIYQAVEEATEEAIINSMTATGPMTGRDGYTAAAIPLDELKAVMRKYGRPLE
jgi:D-aminopeptidase